MLEAAKCYVEPTVPEECYEGLKRGLLDGIEWTNPASNLPMKFHEVCKWALVPAVWQSMDLGDFLINMEAYNELPADLQAILESGMKDFAIKATLNQLVLDMDAMEKYKDMGMEITRWPEEDLITWKEAAAKVYAEECDKDPTFKQAYESKMRWKEKYYKYMATQAEYSHGDEIAYKWW